MQGADAPRDEEQAMVGAGVSRFGDAVEILDLPGPRQLAGDEVLIEVAAAGVGNWDDIARTGGWDLGVIPPMALGVEAAGTVVAVGGQAGDLRIGDEVMTHPLPLRQQGAWADSLIAGATLVSRKPAGVPWDAAGAFPVPALTAEQVLAESLNVVAGEDVLVHGAGGVTGGLLVQLAALRGARVIATAGPRSAERVRRLGALEVLDYHDENWPDRVREMTRGAGVQAAANAAPAGAADAMRAVADGGRLATITSDPPAQQRAITVASFYVRPDAAQLTALGALLAGGRLSVVVEAALPLAEARAALARVLLGGGGGAVVLTPR
jgi:NADPH:quinone reductase-like Zn-dependent oxidoreductase